MRKLRRYNPAKRGKGRAIGFYARYKLRRLIRKLRVGLVIGVTPFALMAALVLFIWQKLDAFERE